MAELENSLGIQATYYFRYPYTFKPEIIKKIHSLGHEVGYHYEVLGKVRGDYKKAIELFEKELNEFRKIADVKTICAHGNPFYKHISLDLWKYYDFKNFDIKGEAFLSVTDIEYFSDAGRRWIYKNKTIADTTDELIKYIKSNEFEKIYINAHPERWSPSNRDWLLDYTRDLIFNIGKETLKKLRIGIYENDTIIY